jgi:hypothetical protein
VLILDWNRIRWIKNINSDYCDLLEKAASRKSDWEILERDTIQKTGLIYRAHLFRMRLQKAVAGTADYKKLISPATRILGKETLEAMNEADKFSALYYHYRISRKKWYNKPLKPLTIRMQRSNRTYLAKLDKDVILALDESIIGPDVPRKDWWNRLSTGRKNQLRRSRMLHVVPNSPVHMSLKKLKKIEAIFHKFKDVAPATEEVLFERLAVTETMFLDLWEKACDELGGRRLVRKFRLAPDESLANLSHHWGIST